uniref:Uncharacterized protein n=1 Tax=Meloidogyne incognita TaxID=6306 RepID=A0A914LM81_MELIC
MELTKYEIKLEKFIFGFKYTKYDITELSREFELDEVKLLHVIHFITRLGPAAF